jgi:pimeloyl-ACP methyl ester carboxylesterase
MLLEMSERYYIPTRRGPRLAALFDAPGSGDRHPFVVLLHGFTGWKEETHLATLADRLLADGISSLRFDAPGSGESEGSWANDYRLTNYLEAVEDVINFAREILPIAPEKIGIWGHSLGGFVALATAANFPECFRAACGSQPAQARSSVSSAEERKWRETGWASFAQDHFQVLDLPYDFFVDRLQYDSLLVARKLKIPVLLLAGTHDNIVPASSIREIYDANTGPKTYVELPMTHSYKDDPLQLSSANRIPAARR